MASIKIKDVKKKVGANLKTNNTALKQQTVSQLDMYKNASKSSGSNSNAKGIVNNLNGSVSNTQPTATKKTTSTQTPSIGVNSGLNRLKNASEAMVANNATTAPMVTPTSTTTATQPTETKSSGIGLFDKIQNGINKGVDKLKEVGSKVGNAVGKGLNELADTVKYQNKDDNSANGLAQYNKALNASKLNSSNELYKATQNARSFMDNYLRAQGLAGSGLGASAYANIDNNYANQYANIVQNYNNKQDEYRQQGLNEYKDAIMNATNKYDRDKITDYYSQQYGLNKGELENLYDTMTPNQTMIDAESMLTALAQQNDDRSKLDYYKLYTAYESGDPTKVQEVLNDTYAKAGITTPQSQGQQVADRPNEMVNSYAVDTNKDQITIKNGELNYGGFFVQNTKTTSANRNELKKLLESGTLENGDIIMLDKTVAGGNDYWLVYNNGTLYGVPANNVKNKEGYNFYRVEGGKVNHIDKR